MDRRLLVGLPLFALATGGAFFATRAQVGDRNADGTLVATDQRVNPAGSVAQFKGRPVDLVVSTDGQLAFVKENRGVTVVGADGTVRQELAATGGASQTGIALSPDGRTLLFSNAGSGLLVGSVNNGRVAWTRTINITGGTPSGATYPQGIAVLDGRRALVCMSRTNRLAWVDYGAGTVDRQIDVDLAPFAVALTPDGKTALVSCWSRRARTGEPTAPSAGTEVPVDARGVGVGGTVCVVDLASRTVTARIPVGAQPSGIAIARNNRAYVANANSDTISVLDIAQRRKVSDLRVRPEDGLPIGVAPSALTLDPSGRRLFVTLGGINAVTILDLAARRPGPPRLIPAGWWPSAVALSGNRLWIGSAKGLGSRKGDPKRRGVYDFTGTVQTMPIPGGSTLASMTQAVLKDLRGSEVRAALEELTDRPTQGEPIPRKVGAPTPIEHVVFILKENRTYDQVFGDIAEGDGDPALVNFGEQIAPNHHALAREYVLLDNYYCNGVLSADGHSWATEGNATSHLERSFGGWTRSYPFGDDPLAASSTGYLWDPILAAGKTFRNYGEFDYAEPVPANATFKQIYDDFVQGTNKIKFTQKIGVANVLKYTPKEAIGWNMRVPDVMRAAIFLKEFREFEQNGKFPNLVFIYLPQDHGSGTTPGMPTMRAHMADNDLALGQIVEAISKSRFWPKTAIFVNEDDPQNGFDHVDGHRSLCLVISPYAKRGVTVSEFYNQTSVNHTIKRILGVRASTLLEARSRLMFECFTETPDFRPYACRPNNVPLDELNPNRSSLTGRARYFADLSLKQPLDKPDAGDEDAKNRILWFATRGDEPYPAHLAGAHGRGLKARGLKLGERVEEDDD